MSECSESWTLEEVAGVQATFGEADAPEALELFAPDDWEVLYALMNSEELVSERDRLWRKADRNRVGVEMGFSIEETILMELRAMVAEHEEATP